MKMILGGGCSCLISRFPLCLPWFASMEHELRQRSHCIAAGLVLILASSLAGCSLQEFLPAGLSPASPTPTAIVPTDTLEPTSTAIVPTDTPEPMPTSTLEPPTATSTPATRNIFEPPPGKVLVLAGQDNSSVGGNSPYNDGYVENVGLPAGVTTYVYMVEGWTNRFGYRFDTGSIDGLNKERYWGGGPACARCYLESPTFSHAIIHLSVAMVDNSEDRIAEGSYDYLIDELARFLAEFDDHPFFIRIGYEFDGLRNEYDPEHYRRAFRRIVDKLRGAGLTNFVTVMSATSASVDPAVWEAYYPGDSYVDWVGYSYWGSEIESTGSLDFARAHNKPVFIAESGPVANYLSVADGPTVWQAWFEPYVAHIRANLDVIKAISYINCYWESQPMWVGRNWGDTRIQANSYIHYRWNALMYDLMFINGNYPVYELIGFSP